MIGNASAAALMKPGLWEINTQNQMDGAAMPAMPNIPPEQMAKLKEMGIKMPAAMGGPGGMNFTIRHCVTKEEAESGVPPQSKDDNKCTPTSVKRDGNKVSWSVQCTGAHPASGSGSVVYESPESYKGNMSVSAKDAQYGAMTMKTSYSGKWLAAACEK
jgi:hypothetical protein